MHMTTSAVVRGNLGGTLVDRIGNSRFDLLVYD